MNLLAKARLFLLLLVSPALVAQTQPERVGGRVISALDGHPILHASVTLTVTREQKTIATTVADEAGRFRFDPVPSGKYRITGTANGYLPAAYLPHEQYSTAIVTGAGLPTDSIILQLTPVAAIAGHIRDDDGDPISQANVTLYREDPTDAHHVTRFRNQASGEDGEYEFPRLAAGRYYLSVSAAPWYAVHPRPENPNASVQYRTAVDPALDVAYPETFYPGALDSDGASPLNLTGGGQLAADIQMHAQRAVSVTLRTTPGEKPNEQRPPQLTRTVFGVEEPVNAQESGIINGARQIAGLAPGRYNLEQSAPNGMPIRSQPLDLTNESVAMDMPRPADLASVTLTASMTGSEQLPAGLHVNLRNAGRNLNRTLSGATNDKGVSEFQNVPPGEYSPIATARGRSGTLSVAALSVAGKPATDRRIHVTGGGRIAVELTLSSASPLLEGFARHEDKPAIGTMVVLVPAGADTGEQLFRRDQTDLDGSFALNNVAPGNYILIAIDDGWPLRWTDLRTLAPYLIHGIPVSVPTTAGSGAIRLPSPVPTQPRETK